MSCAIGFGRLEDKFFASVFLGSGLLFLAMTFSATAVGVALSSSHAFAQDAAAHAEVVAFGQMLMLTLTKTYALRMAAVFMISLATIWLKTGLMPRWLVGVTYLVAVGLLLSSDISMWLTLAFPIWVLVVSVLLLVRPASSTSTATTSHSRHSSGRRCSLERGPACGTTFHEGACRRLASRVTDVTVSPPRKACEGQSFTASRACSSSASGTSSTSTTTMPSSS